MTSRLVEELARRAPQARAFPDPGAMAARTERFYRERIRAGYRAPFLRTLARDVASGRVETGGVARFRPS